MFNSTFTGDIKLSMKRIAVIGAGASGLTAIKCCLDEDLEPVCFERDDYIGGLWHYTGEVEEGQACVMKSTVINTSKEMMCYSDFPIPAEYPMYMHNTCVDKYFHKYADKFDLKKYINFKTEVLFVKPSVCHKETGKWEIETKAKDSEENKYNLFDGVLVCTGHHAEKNLPEFPGLDNFRGKVTHTHEYKDFHGYEDKKVLIIGIGNSGGDVATELSRISSKVYLSTRSGSWLYNRVSTNGNPVDMLNFTRFYQGIYDKLPTFGEAVIAWQLSRRFDHQKYCLQPKHGPLSAHPTVNDELPNRIAAGSIVIKANVAEFTETGAVFEDGTKIDDLDCVVLATGYIFGFPFLDKSVIDVKENTINLYKNMFPPDMENHTLAIIGCVQPFGAIMPLSEMQCRLATRVFKGVKKLPGRPEIWRDIREKQDAMADRYIKSQRHTIQVDFIQFMDELAELVGCKPDFKRLFMNDPILAVKCVFGPCTPYQFRLTGPGTWKGARQAIMTQWDRTYKPLQTRPCDAKSSKFIGTVYLLIAIAVVLLLYCII